MAAVHERPRQPRFALDLVEDALGRINLTARTTIVSAPQFTPSLLSGLFDGSGAAWKDPERERALIFSQPYLENRLVLVGRHGADVSAKTPADLKGKRIAIVEGYSYGEAIDSAGPVWVRSRSEEDSLTQLLKGAVDYTLMDELVVHYIVSNYPKESGAKLQIGSTPLVTRELHFAVNRARADAVSIVERFNAQIRSMIADRTYHRLLHVDWIRADVDGDGVPEYVPLNDRPGRRSRSTPTRCSRRPRRPRRRQSRVSISAATSTATGRACPKTTRSVIRTSRIRADRRAPFSSSPGERARKIREAAATRLTAAAAALRRRALRWSPTRTAS